MQADFLGDRTPRMQCSAARALMPCLSIRTTFTPQIFAAKNLTACSWTLSDLPGWPILFWHEAAEKPCPHIGRDGVNSRQHMLNMSSSHVDPTATSASILCCGSEVGFSLYQSARLSRYDAAF